MYIHCIQNIWLPKLLFLLTFLDHKSNSVTLKDLKIVCTYGFPFDFNEHNRPPKDTCTAVAATHYVYPHTNFDLNKIKANLPFVYIYRITIFYLNEYLELVADNVLDYLDDINTTIKKVRADVLVLHFLNKGFLVLDDTIVDNTVQAQIVELIKAIKSNNDDILIGLQIYNNAEQNTELLIESIDKQADFYVMSSYNYVPCHYHNKQSKMAQPPSKTDLANNIKELMKSKIDLKKVFLTIELVAKSWKNDEADFFDKWSYSHLCEADPGEKRKYCTQSLENLYEQASVVFNTPLPGVFIKSIDFDDWKGCCICGHFPALRVIKDGVLNLTETGDLKKCKTYGVLPRDRK